MMMMYLYICIYVLGDPCLSTTTNIDADCSHHGGRNLHPCSLSLIHSPLTEQFQSMDNDQDMKSMHVFIADMSYMNVHLYSYYSIKDTQCFKKYLDIVSLMATMTEESVPSLGVRYKFNITAAIF